MKSGKLSLMKVDAALTGQTAAQTRTMTAAQEAHVAALQKELTAEQLSNVQKQIRVATIQGLLTAQQQEYLQNLNLTASSANYEAVAMGVLNVEQRMALSKVDMTGKSAVYRAVLEQEVAAKNQSHAATLSAMRTEVKAAAVKMESARADAIAGKAAVERAYLEVYRAQQTGTAEQVAIASKKMEAAEDNAALSRKAALAAQTDFYAKKKLLEATATAQSTMATRQSTVAGAADVVVTNTLTISKISLFRAVIRAKWAFQSLWATMMANPFTVILTVVGLVISAFTLFGKKTEDANSAMGEFQETTKKEIDNLNVLMAILKNTEAGTKAHKSALDKVNATLKEYNKELLTENATVDQLQEKYKELTDAINESAAARIKAKYIEQFQKEQSSALEEAKNKLIKEGGRLQDTGGGYTRDVQSIKDMNKAIYDFIEIEALESAEKIKNLSGDAYQKAYAGIFESISKKIKESAKASDKDMAAFSFAINAYLTDVIGKLKETDGKTIELNKSSEYFMKVGGDKPAVSNSIDYAKMSFSELEAKVQETQKEIDNINAKTVKVDTDNTKLKELKDLLDLINGTISKKDADLNTESGISARVKQLKDERANVEINGAKYKELGKQITALENRLPKTQAKNENTADKAESKTEQLKQKQLEADRKLEEARISIMEDGYEKRKAALDLQHRRNLEDIDKEERELEKARNEAGKKGLSDDEKRGFSDRRSFEDQSYLKSQNKLFDGEVSYKKEQYALYFRWVRNMGEDVANAQFSNLLKDGNSYKEYVEKQIAALKNKQYTGSLSEGEANQLITLNMQYDEITGAKTAMDQFKESVTRAISQAETLAEKIQVVADARAKLNNGGSGLVGGDEIAEASLYLSEKDAKNEEDVQDGILKNYRTFEEKKKSIQKQYATLRLAAQKTNDQDRINQVNKGEAEALSALTAEMLKQSDSWEQLFGDLDSLSVAQIQKLLSDIEKELGNANLKLNPVDYKAVTDSLNRAKEVMIQKNPFKALGKFYDDYVAAKKRLATARAEVAGGMGSQKEVEKAQSDMKKASAGVFKSIDEVTSAATECGNSLANMFDALGMGGVADGIGTAVELMGQLGNAAQSVGKLMSGDVIGGVTGIVSSVTSVVGIFAKLHDKKYEKRIQNLQKEIDELERSYSRLERAFNNTYWTFNDSQRDAYEKNIDLINQQIAALERQAVAAKKISKLSEYAQLTKQIQELQGTLAKAKEGDDMFGLFEQQKENLRKQQEDIKKQIESENKKKKKDKGKISGWEEQIEAINQQIEDLDRAMMETLSGTDVKSAINEFADALVEAYSKGEDAADALGAKTKEVLKKAVVEALKRQFLAKAIDDAVVYLGGAMKDNILSDSEKAKFEAMVKAGADRFNLALSGIGDWIKDLDDEKETDPLTGAVKSMSEETGSLIAGKFNAFVINQAEQTSLIRQSLLYQAQIAENTRYCKRLDEVADTLKRIENKDSSLLSQGIV